MAEEDRLQFEPVPVIPGGIRCRFFNPYGYKGSIGHKDLQRGGNKLTRPPINLLMIPSIDNTGNFIVKFARKWIVPGNNHTLSLSFMARGFNGTNRA